MSKLPSLKAIEIIKTLQKKGFIIDRIKGSHYILFNVESKVRIIVSYHNMDLPKGTLSEIIKQSGLKQEDFFE
jgi:predicted RNA binding protein YcfA (HicA-like mRNA interferase family)